MADTQPLIAVRIKDGIFVGNVAAAHDEDFLFMNKVTHIVNCAGGEVPDLFVDSGIQYLTFPWKDTPGAVNTTVMFDSADRNIEQAVRFIDKGLENGDCVLVHSFYGLSRSPAIVAAYFMVKYGWKVDNALSFLAMAHQEMNIKPHFLRQLRMFAKRHDVDCDVFDLQVDDEQFALDNDQWMLRNTLLNGLTADNQQRNELFKDCTKRLELPELFFRAPTKRRKRLSFVDTHQGTSVGSNATTPVVGTKPTAAHADPYGAADMSFYGASGAGVIRTHKPKEAIEARASSPNIRPLESRPDVNPKGRQALPLRNMRQEMSEPVASARLNKASEQMAQSEPTRDSHGHTVIVQRGGAATLVDTQRRSLPATSSIPQASTLIRSPFALTSQAPRNGSPLPMQRQQQTARPQQSVPQQMQHLRPAAPPASIQDLRNQQPMQQARAASPTQLARDAPGRNSSPVGRQQITASSGPSMSMTSQIMSARTSSPRGQQPLNTYAGGSAGRRPSSPLARGPQAFPSQSLPPSTNISRQAPVYSSASTLQQQRASSPMSRAAPLAQPMSTRPLAAGSRTSSPRPVGSPIRTSSPMRSSLADQYLGLSASTLPRTTTAAVAPSSLTVLRGGGRSQPAAVAARRI